MRPLSAEEREQSGVPGAGHYGGSVLAADPRWAHRPAAILGKLHVVRGVEAQAAQDACQHGAYNGTLRGPEREDARRMCSAPNIPLIALPPAPPLPHPPTPPPRLGTPAPSVHHRKGSC